MSAGQFQKGNAGNSPERESHCGPALFHRIQQSLLDLAKTLPYVFLFFESKPAREKTCRVEGWPKGPMWIDGQIPEAGSSAIPLQPRGWMSRAVVPFLRPGADFRDKRKMPTVFWGFPKFKTTPQMFLFRPVSWYLEVLHLGLFGGFGAMFPNFRTCLGTGQTRG